MPCVSDLIVYLAIAFEGVGGAVCLITMALEMRTYKSYEKAYSVGFVLLGVAIGLMFVAAVARFAEIFLHLC